MIAVWKQFVDTWSWHSSPAAGSYAHTSHEAHISDGSSSSSPGTVPNHLAPVQARERPSPHTHSPVIRCQSHLGLCWTGAKLFRPTDCKWLSVPVLKHWPLAWEHWCSWEY